MMVLYAGAMMVLYAGSTLVACWWYAAWYAGPKCWCYMRVLYAGAICGCICWCYDGAMMVLNAGAMMGL